MVGRFIHYYPGYTFESALKIPWRRFVVGLRKVAQLEAEEDLRALTIATIAANPGKKGEHHRALVKRLQLQAGQSALSSGKEVHVGDMPNIIAAKPGSLKAEYARIKAEADEMERKRAEATKK